MTKSSTTITCGACGRPFPNMLKLSKHIRDKHPGKAVSAVSKPKQ